MLDLISRQAAIDAVSKGCQELRGVFDRCEENLLALPYAQPEQRWIPCDERLPERNQICIVTDETRRCTYEYGLHDETYDTENGWTYLGHKIIAWMPLPEPYAERRTDEL